MKSTDIVIDIFNTIGKPPYHACASDPVFEYDDNNNRTDKIIGYKVDIVLPSKKFAHLSVKVPTTKNPLTELVDVLEVDFTNLSLGVYLDRYNRLQISAKADSVLPANSKGNLKINPKAE